VNHPQGMNKKEMAELQSQINRPDPGHSTPQPPAPEPETVRMDERDEDGKLLRPERGPSLMLCTKCRGLIQRGQTFYRTKKGAHHGSCPTLSAAPEQLVSAAPEDHELLQRVEAEAGWYICAELNNEQVTFRANVREALAKIAASLRHEIAALREELKDVHKQWAVDEHSLRTEIAALTETLKAKDELPDRALAKLEAIRKRRSRIAELEKLRGD
jgi:hypothetical protein